MESVKVKAREATEAKTNEPSTLVMYTLFTVCLGIGVFAMSCLLSGITEYGVVGLFTQFLNTF